MIKPTNNAISAGGADRGEPTLPGHKGGVVGTQNIKERNSTPIYRSNSSLYENTERTTRLSMENEPKLTQDRRPIKLINQLPPLSNGLATTNSQQEIFSSQQLVSSSQIRKRSRIGQDDGYSEGEEDEENENYNMDELLQKLSSQLDAIFKKSERGRTSVNRAMINTTFKRICLEEAKRSSAYINMANKLIESQEERNVLQKQVLECQLLSITKQNGVGTYLQAATRGQAKAITKGTNLPIPSIPEPVRHVPAENILIIKAIEKGTTASKAKQEEFRQDLKTTLGEDLMSEIVAVRPTRFGGHTIIFEGDKGRDNALSIFRKNEELQGIEPNSSNVIAPKKKMAKVVCREPPGDIMPEAFLQELYNRHNPLLQKVNKECREAKIHTTRLGWVFELSTMEAAAIQGQGWRMRYGFGREIRVEEFIPMQQCYRCCAFGHNAHECRSEAEYCRLCGKVGHSGRDCLHKDDKPKWQCSNCMWHNQIKGTNLDTSHGAAQLHKCPVAQNQKLIKKQQLATSGVFTTPLSDIPNLFKEGTSNSSEPTQINGFQGKQGKTAEGTKRRTRSRSTKRTGNNKTYASSTFTTATTSTSSATSTRTQSTQEKIDVNTNASQAGNRIEPKVTEGWRTVGRGGEVYNEGRGRVREVQAGGGININNTMEPCELQDIHMENPIYDER